MSRFGRHAIEVARAAAVVAGYRARKTREEGFNQDPDRDPRSTPMAGNRVGSGTPPPRKRVEHPSFNCGAVGLGLAQVRAQDHIFRMASRKPTFVISKLHDDLARGGVVGLLVFVGLIALLAAVYFGL
jgi:hypothetical protein